VATLDGRGGRRTPSALAIVDERPGDDAAIRRLLEGAFGQATEADLVDALRRGCDDLISLVAVLHDQVVGHILFSPATIQTETAVIVGFGLAPMAVMPDLQGRGIGSALVWEGLDRLRRQACPYVVVLGHPSYYPRFGFEPAVAHGIRCPWEVPEGAFMVLPLDRRAMAGISGIARYRHEFELVI
jgi:putative acetyltransferase